jgi:hypothetical protein
VTGQCACELPLGAPVGYRVWQPQHDPAPEPDTTPVQSVTIVGDDPLVMRAVLTASGWLRSDVGR